MKKLLLFEIIAFLLFAGIHVGNAEPCIWPHAEDNPPLFGPVVKLSSNGSARGSGSGVFIGDKRTIVTAFHVVAGDTKIDVTFNDGTAQGSCLRITLSQYTAVSFAYDLIVLKIDDSVAKLFDVSLPVLASETELSTILHTPIKLKGYPGSELQTYDVTLTALKELAGAEPSSYERFYEGKTDGDCACDTALEGMSGVVIYDASEGQPWKVYAIVSWGSIHKNSGTHSLFGATAATVQRLLDEQQAPESLQFLAGSEEARLSRQATEWQTLVNFGEVSAVVRLAQSSLSPASKDFFCLYMAAECCMLVGEPDSACIWLESAIENSPPSIAKTINLEQVYRSYNIASVDRAFTQLNTSVLHMAAAVISLTSDDDEPIFVVPAIPVDVHLRADANGRPEYNAELIATTLDAIDSLLETTTSVV